MLFQDILRGLLPEKISVADAMIWCVDHATCAKEITQCLFESLTIDETPLHKKASNQYDNHKPLVCFREAEVKTNTAK